MNAADMPMWNDLSAIKTRHDDLKAQIASLQAQLKIVKNTLEDMFTEPAMQNLAQQGKDFGSTTVTSGEHKITLEFRKRVDWDQEALANILDRMDPDAARHYATIKYSVAEAKFQNAPPEIKALLSEARTVLPQGVSVDIQEKG